MGPHVGLGLHGTITPWANNSTHALNLLLVTCIVCVECVHRAYLLLPSAGCWQALGFVVCSLQLAHCPAAAG